MASVKGSFPFIARESIGKSLLVSFTGVYKHIGYDSKKVLIDTLPKNKLFEDILKCEVNPISIRRLVVGNEPYTPIDKSNEELISLYESIEDIETKHFFEYIFVSPIEYYKVKISEIEKMGVYSDMIIEQYIAEHPEVKASMLLGKYSLYSYLTNPHIVDNLFTPINVDGISSISTLESTLDIMTKYSSTKGKSSMNLSESINFIKRITPIWDSLKMASSTQDPEESSYMIEDKSSTPTPEEISAIFAGNYSMVPNDFTPSKGNAYGLVSSIINFNKLSNDRKLQVSNYLMNNRHKFNMCLTDACNTIIAELEKSIDSNARLSSGAFNQKMTENLNRCIKSLYSAYETVRGGNMNNKLNFIMKALLPLTNTFSSRLMNECGEYSMGKITSLLNGANLSIFGQSMSMIGGDEEEKPVEKTTEPVEIEVIKVIEVPVEQSRSPYEFIGGDSILSSGVKIVKAEAVLKEMVNTQTNFNNKFSTLYRKLITDINGVEFNDIFKDKVNIYYAIPTILNSITINDSKSTIYISGLYGKHNYNSIYSETLKSAVEELKKLNIPQIAKVIEDVNEIQRLVETTGNKAQELLSQFSTARDATPNLLINGAHQIKIRCDLTSNDFNSMNEAIQRIFWKLNTKTSQSDIRNQKEDLQKYIEKTKDRTKIIDEYFDRMEQDILFEVRNISPSVQYRADYISAKKALLEKRRALYKYVNTVFDNAFTRQKLKELDSKVLDEKQIAKMEDAFLLFKKAKVSARFEEEYSKLCEHLEKTSSMFALAKQLKKVISHSHYIEFIETLYREMDIFDKSFNWNEFRDNILNFITINSFEIDYVYNIDFANANHCHIAAGAPPVVTPFTNQDIDNTFGVNNTKIVMSPGRALFNAFARLNNTANLINEFNVHMDHIKKLTENRCEVNIDTNLGTYYINDEICALLLGKINGRLHNVNNGTNGARGLRSSYGPINPDGIVGVEAYLNLNKPSNDSRFIEMIFDSLMSNIVLVIDKYWQLKYHGSEQLPLNLIQNLSGGVLPGSIFDVKTLHDYTNAEVIPEAVPFYICALNCAEFYVNTSTYQNTHGNLMNVISNINGRRHIRISKISSLYQLIRLFASSEDDGYDAKVKSLTIQQLNTALSILNLIWNRTTGTNTHRLSSAIDIFMSELNTCIYITDDAHETLLMSEYKVTDDIDRKLFSELESSLNLMQAAITSSNMNTVSWSNPELAQTKFESILRNAMEKIRDRDPSSRMSELRNILRDSNRDAEAEYNEYFQFMDGVMAPLVTTYRSYSVIFSLFNYYYRKYGGGNRTYTNSVDLDMINITHRRTTKSAWKWLTDGTIKLNRLMGLILFAGRPVVQLWNRVLFDQMIANYLRSGQMKDPGFWNVNDITTYPTQREITFTIDTTEANARVMNIEALRQIWPSLRAKSVGDYFELALREYANDIDEVVHLFMSYPNIGGETIRALERDLHDKISFEKLIEIPQIKRTLDILRSVEIKKSGIYCPPNWNERRIELPAFASSSGRAIQPIRFEYSNSGRYTLDGTRLSLDINKSLRNKTDITRELKADFSSFVPTQPIRNGFTDRVLFVLASCNPTDWTIPYKMVQLITSNPVLNRIAKPILVSNDAAITYDKNCNPLTQNIIARSSTEVNQNKEYFDYSPQSIASMIAIIPYLINMVSTANDTYAGNAAYFNIAVLDEANSLISCLNQFYNELSAYAQPLGFLQRNTFNITNDRDHPMGELVHYTTCSIDDVTNAVAMEWANKFAFANLKDISFPDFKNRDKFEWYKQFEESKLRSPAFAKNSSIILENNGRLVWNAMIANTSRRFVQNPQMAMPGANDILRRVRAALHCYIRSCGKRTRMPLQMWLNAFFGNMRNIGALTGGDKSDSNIDALITAITHMNVPITKSYLDSLSGGALFTSDIVGSDKVIIEMLIDGSTPHEIYNEITGENIANDNALKTIIDNKSWPEEHDSSVRALIAYMNMSDDEKEDVSWLAEICTVNPTIKNYDEFIAYDLLPLTFDEDSNGVPSPVNIEAEIESVDKQSLVNVASETLKLDIDEVRSSIKNGIYTPEVITNEVVRDIVSDSIQRFGLSTGNEKIGVRFSETELGNINRKTDTTKLRKPDSITNSNDRTPIPEPRFSLEEQRRIAAGHVIHSLFYHTNMVDESVIDTLFVENMIKRIEETRPNFFNHLTKVVDTVKLSKIKMLIIDCILRSRNTNQQLTVANITKGVNIAKFLVGAYASFADGNLSNINNLFNNIINNQNLRTNDGGFLGKINVLSSLIEGDTEVLDNVGIIKDRSNGRIHNNANIIIGNSLHDITNDDQIETINVCSSIGNIIENVNAGAANMNETIYGFHYDNTGVNNNITFTGKIDDVIFNNVNIVNSNNNNEFDKFVTLLNILTINCPSFITSIQIGNTSYPVLSNLFATNVKSVLSTDKFDFQGNGINVNNNNAGVNARSIVLGFIRDNMDEDLYNRLLEYTIKNRNMIPNTLKLNIGDKTNEALISMVRSNDIVGMFTTVVNPPYKDPIPFYGRLVDKINNTCSAALIAITNYDTNVHVNGFSSWNFAAANNNIPRYMFIKNVNNVDDGKLITQNNVAGGINITDIGVGSIVFLGKIQYPTINDDQIVQLLIDVHSLSINAIPNRAYKYYYSPAHAMEPIYASANKFKSEIGDETKVIDAQDKPTIADVTTLIANLITAPERQSAMEALLYNFGREDITRMLMNSDTKNIDPNNKTVSAIRAKFNRDSFTIFDLRDAIQNGNDDMIKFLSKELMNTIKPEVQFINVVLQWYSLGVMHFEDKLDDLKKVLNILDKTFEKFDISEVAIEKAVTEPIAVSEVVFIPRVSGNDGKSIIFDSKVNWRDYTNPGEITNSETDIDTIFTKYQESLNHVTEVNLERITYDIINTDDNNDSSLLVNGISAFRTGNNPTKSNAISLNGETLRSNEVLRKVGENRKANYVYALMCALLLERECGDMNGNGLIENKAWITLPNVLFPVPNVELVGNLINNGAIITNDGNANQITIGVNSDINTRSTDVIKYMIGFNDELRKKFIEGLIKKVDEINNPNVKQFIYDTVIYPSSNGFTIINTKSTEEVIVDKSDKEFIPSEEDLHRQLNIISNNNIDLMFKSLDKVNSTGFISNSLRGGAIPVTLLSKRLINLNPVAYKPSDMLRELYSRSYPSIRLFKHLFGFTDEWKLNDAQKIFAATINYFHKQSLDVSQLFERMVYASTLMGTATMRLAAERLAKVVYRQANTGKNDMATLIAKYIEKFSVNQKLAIDDFEYNEDIKATGFNPDNHLSIDVANAINAIANGYETNILELPHANPNFIHNFFKFASKNDKLSAKLIPFTKAGNSILRLDALCTYVDCLVTLMHMTDYYDHDSDSHIPYTSAMTDFNQFDML